MAGAVDIRVRATTQAGGFREGPLQLGSGWGTVNLARPDVRKALVEHVGVHVRVHPEDEPKVRAAGLELKNGRLVKATADGAAARKGAAPDTAASA